MSELSKLKNELKSLKEQKEIAKVKKQIEEIKNPSKIKATGKKVAGFFKPRGNEKQALENLMNM